MESEEKRASCRWCGGDAFNFVIDKPNLAVNVWLCSKNKQLGGDCPSDLAYVSSDHWNKANSIANDEPLRSIARSIITDAYEDLIAMTPNHRGQYREFREEKRRFLEALNNIDREESVEMKMVLTALKWKNPLT